MSRVTSFLWFVVPRTSFSHFSLLSPPLPPLPLHFAHKHFHTKSTNQKKDRTIQQEKNEEKKRQIPPWATTSTLVLLNFVLLHYYNLVFAFGVPFFPFMEQYPGTFSSLFLLFPSTEGIGVFFFFFPRIFFFSVLGTYRPGWCNTQKSPSRRDGEHRQPVFHFFSLASLSLRYPNFLVFHSLATRNPANKTFNIS